MNKQKSEGNKNTRMESNVILPMPTDCTHLDHEFATARDGLGTQH